MIVLDGTKPDYSQLPKTPGVYIYRDKDNNIIYIGKARVLRDRIRSYFSGGKDQHIKTRLLVTKIHSIDWIIVDSEVEALLLENNLIKQHMPKYNIDLKDSKRYAYIKITGEEYPRIISTRKVTKDGTYFGPYTDGMARRELVRLAVQLFKIRTCRVLPKKACLNFHIGLCTAPCIQNVSHEQYMQQVADAREFLKGNTGPIIKRLEEEMQEASASMKFERALEIRNQLAAISRLDERQKVERVKDYDQHVIALVVHNDNAFIELFTISRGVILGKKEFCLESQEDIFEEFITNYYSTADVPHEIIVSQRFWSDDAEHDALEEYLAKLSKRKVSLIYPEKGEKKQLALLAEKNAMLNFEENSVLGELKDALNLPVTPQIIECFDISNLGYDYIVAAMVRYVDGKPDKDNYRKYEIRTVKGKNDDFAAMSEVVFRRYRYLSELKSPAAKNADDPEEKPETTETIEMPNLIIIDGGKGQLNAALGSLSKLGLKIPIVGLAKENEELYLPGEDEPRRFDKNSRMMLLVRRIRDSVHNFVLSYNRKKRQMRLREQFKGNA